MQGVPIRLELGPKDMQNKSVMLARRDTGAKEIVAWGDVPSRVPELLEQIQVSLHPYSMLCCLPLHDIMLSHNILSSRNMMSSYNIMPTDNIVSSPYIMLTHTIMSCCVWDLDQTLDTC